MGMMAPIGGRLVTLDELDDIALQGASQLEELRVRPRIRKLNLTDDVVLSGRSLSRQKALKSLTNPYQGIGPNKPLTIVLEHIYIGNYPDAMPWFPIDKGDVLVTSAFKPFQQTAPAPRAMHALVPNAKRRTNVALAAYERGSQLLYYSPAVTDVSIQSTFQLAVDRDFDKEIGASFGTALAAAAALPVFAPAAPYLIAAGLAVPLAVRAASLLARPQTFYERTDEINLTRPGLNLPDAGALVLYPTKDASGFAGYGLMDESTARGDFSLKDEEGESYKGDLAYMVITLDGTAQPTYDGFSAHAASAALIERFFGGGGGLSGVLGILSESLTLYNDLEYLREAAALAPKIKNAKKGKERDDLVKRQDALKKNIQNPELLATLG